MVYRKVATCPYQKKIAFIVNDKVDYTGTNPACGVADIILHTIERYFTNADTLDLTDQIAAVLVKNVMVNAKLVLQNPNDYKARAELMWSGSLSHNDLTSARSHRGDWAVHQLGHELSAKYGIAHGASLTAIWSTWANYVFQEAATVHPSKMNAYLEEVNATDTFNIKEDAAFKIYDAIRQFKMNSVDPELKRFEATIAPLNYMYMKTQMGYFSDRDYYPDANQTLRVTYGQVQAIDLGTSNQYETTLEDLIPRYNPNIEEFNIPQKLRTIYENKNYGKWAANGTVPINFIATNHTSGGNSGSPVLNGKGELIGLNFDRIWQGTMSDLFYDPNLCRNISVDIRYVLFIMDKYGDANWLFKEMKLVK